MKIVLVYNSRAGGSQALAALRKDFHAAGITVEKAIPLDSKVRKSLRPFIQKGAFIAVVGVMVR